MVSAPNGRTPLRRGQISWGKQHLNLGTLANASSTWMVLLMASHTGRQREQRLLWSMHAEHGWGRINVPAIGSVWEWNRDHIVGCFIESRSLLNWSLMREERGAEHLQWGVLYAKSQYVKSAGQRGMISISSKKIIFLTKYPTSKPATPLCRGTITSSIMARLTWSNVHNALPRHEW